MADHPVRELKFRTLAKQLRKEISTGYWEPGAKLPTEKELVAHRGVSLTTVRRALEELSNEGLIIRRQGSGSYISTDAPRTAGLSRTIGVLVPSSTHYYPRVLAGIEAALSEASSRLVLACTYYDPSREERQIQSLLSSGIDGLILVPHLLTSPDPARRIEQLFSLPVPVVMLERRDFDTRVSDRSEYIRTDHEGGAYDAVVHLRTLGHERIGIIYRHENATGMWLRYGYEQAVRELSLPALPINIPTSEWSLGDAQKALKDLRSTRTTAALVLGDRQGALLEAAARHANLRIPEDLALVSYDDESADTAEIPLTAVSPPKYRMGRLAAEVLLYRLESGELKPRHQISLRPPIVIRDSCGAMITTQQ